jgi:hypothetical protein
MLCSAGNGEINYMRGSIKVKPPTFFLRKCNCNKNKIYMDDLCILAIMRLFFHKVSFIFNALLPVLSKILYTNVVKFPASTLEHIMKILF